MEIPVNKVTKILAAFTLVACLLAVGRVTIVVMFSRSGFSWKCRFPLATFRTPFGNGP